MVLQLRGVALQLRRGYQRHFYGPDDGASGDVRVHLYEFCEPAAAAQYLRHTRDRLVSPLWGSVEIDAEGLPEPGVALLQEAEVVEGSFVAIVQADGPYYVEVGAWALSETIDELTAKAVEIARAQVDALR